MVRKILYIETLFKIWFIQLYLSRDLGKWVSAKTGISIRFSLVFPLLSAAESNIKFLPAAFSLVYLKFSRQLDVRLNGAVSDINALHCI